MNSILNDNNKRFEEMVIIEKIENFIKKDRYSDIDDFIRKNPNFHLFLQNNKLDAVLSRSRNSINEDDYIKIISKIKENHKKQQLHNSESVNTINIGDKKIVTYKTNDKEMILDDSYNNREFNKQLDYLQQTNTDFRTNDINKNTDNMMNYMKNEIKDEIKPKYLNDVNTSSLNNEEKRMFATASLFQEQINSPIKIDLNRNMIFDKDNNVYSMEKRESGIIILPLESTKKVNKHQGKQMIKQLIKTPVNTGFKNGFIDAAILAFITGSLFGSIILNLCYRMLNIMG